ncbi:MAG: FAD-binding oxidoreductase [Rhodococcus sp. (in: high G+C Gram-positive bacteria)]|nr:MAG: FAD-binding oxidoreductase [Rhodococcus sp. (in: high G+C Gram-positive bacteria)]
MTPTTGGDLGILRTAMAGPVLGPDDAGYDEARRVWNADIDRRPAAIARCRGAADVAAAIAFATEHAMEIAVRAGAHSTAGASVLDDGLVIDLGPINHVAVDPDVKRARVGGGALLSDLDAATQAHGLAVPAGLISHTGIAGLTLGGGMGWLTRRAGLSIDNLVSAEVVTADGRILRAAADENPDLFWAIRGGGGNFGVVTEFEFRLHQVGPVVQFGLLFWGLDQGTEVLRLAREVIDTLPRELNIVIAGLNAPPAPFVPEKHHLQPGYALVITGFGTPQTHHDVLARIRDTLPPLFEFVTPMPYVEVQRLLDESTAWGLYNYDKSCYLEALSDEAIAVVTEQLPQKNSPLSMLLFYRLDEAYCDTGDDDTAFGGGRTPRFATFVVGVCPTPDLLPAERAWVRSLWQALRPHSVGIGAYVNAMSEFEQGQVRATYGPVKYARLAEIKGKYDPDNIFHRNANIEPDVAHA